MALSDKDRQVLDSIFNPLQLGGGAELDSWMIPVHDDKNDFDQSSEKTELSESERKALQLEADAILLAEKEDYKRSLELFSEAIALYPRRPNSYNNRAQVYRLLDAGDGLDECKWFYSEFMCVKDELNVTYICSGPCRFNESPKFVPVQGKHGKERILPTWIDLPEDERGFGEGRF